MKESALDLMMAPDLKQRGSKKKTDITITFLRNILNEEKLNEFIDAMPVVNTLYSDILAKYKKFEKEKLSKYIIDGNKGKVFELIDFINDNENSEMFSLFQLFNDFNKARRSAEAQRKANELLKLKNMPVKYPIKFEIENIIKEVNVLLSPNYEESTRIDRLQAIKTHAENALSLVNTI